MGFNKIVKREFKDSYTVAERCYGALFGINGLHLSDRELQLFAFTAMRGDISNSKSKRDFIERYNTTMATLNNTISSLKRKKLFVKIDNKVQITPSLRFNFAGEVNITLNLKTIESDNK